MKDRIYFVAVRNIFCSHIKFTVIAAVDQTLGMETAKNGTGVKYNSTAGTENIDTGSTMDPWSDGVVSGGGWC